MNDLIASMRFLARRRTVAAVAVLTMACALGANTAAFSVVRAFLFAGFAVPEPDRLIVIAPERDLPGRGTVLFNDAYPNYQLIRQTQRAFADVSCLVSNIASWDDHGEIRSLQATLATASFFSTMRVQPILGRAFTASEEGPSPAPVVVVSYALWNGALAGDSSIIGRALTINGVLTTVIGVMPEGFAQPAPTDIWQPFDLPPAQRAAINGGRLLTVFGRIADGRSRAAMLAELAEFTRRTREANAPDNRDYHYVPQTLREQLLSGADATVLLIQAGAAVLLMLAVLNLASLLMAWGFERAPEMAVRVALGARQHRVMRLLLTQSAVVVAMGFGFGTVVAFLAVSAARRMNFGTSSDYFLANLRLDGAILLFSAAAAAVAALAAGTLPVWFSRRRQYPSHATRVAFAAALLGNLARDGSLRMAGFTNTLPVGDVPWGG
jgi:putative ABC transport system permease protein